MVPSVELVVAVAPVAVLFVVVGAEEPSGNKDGAVGVRVVDSFVTEGEVASVAFVAVFIPAFVGALDVVV